MFLARNIAYVYLSHVVRTQLLRNGGQATHITGPTILIGQFYNDISLPSGPIHNAGNPLVDSDWEDETPLTQGSEVRRKRRHRPQKKRSFHTFQSPSVERTTIKLRGSFYLNDSPLETPTLPTTNHRIAKLSNDEITQAVLNNNHQLLNTIAAVRKVEGYTQAYIDTDSDGVGLCLKSRHSITLQPNQEHKLWEYKGDSVEVSERENSNTIPLTQLKYGCEYTYNGKHYRKFPRGPLHSLSQFIQAPQFTID